MGCLLSRAYELSPRLLRDLEAASEGTSHAQHHLVPPRPVRHELGWSDLSSVQLISASGGSCDVFAAVLDGESVAVKRVKSNAADAVRDLRAEAALLEELGAVAVLDLSDNAIHDGGLQALIAASVSRPELKELRLAGNPFGQLGRTMLQGLASLRPAELKGSVGEGPNKTNYSDQSSVRIRLKFRKFR